jgi:polyisoprenoid-binding protein YceI
MAPGRHWLRWVIAGALAVVVLAVAGPFVYIHFIEGKAPAPLGLTPGASPSSAAPGSGGGSTATGGTIAGSWRIGPGSTVGYRVKEVLVGQDNIAVGRTHAVTGQVTIGGSTVTAASFTVQMATIHSDQSQRDTQFDGRIMDVATYPTGTFSLTRPIALAPVPAVGAVKSYPATGKLTMHGHSRQVTFTVSAERTTAGIKISGSIPVTFADWSIPNPSFGSFVTTQNHGTLEFLLVLSRA